MKLILALVALVALFFAPLSAMANPLTIAADQSTITFAGKHAGNDFTGTFEKWTGGIDFNTDDLENSAAKITIDLASAKTGNGMYDGTLPTADWFDVTNHPTATFTSTAFEKTENGFRAAGDFTIKGVTKPLTFDFTVSGDAPIHMTAQFPIHRLDYGIGQNSDPTAEWVDDIIMIKLNVTAK